MKKTKFLALLLGTAALFYFTGCNNGSEIPPIEPPIDVPVTTLNLSDIKGFGTIWGSTVSDKSASTSRSALNVNGSETLIAFDEDGNATEVLSEILPKPEKLADGYDYQPVREIYQCPYTTIEDEAKGFYIVFSWYIDWWKDTNGNVLDSIGQIIYVKPDGTTKDILGAKKYLLTYLKENDDVDYIKFDEDGNIYMLIQNETENKPYIVRYNPLNDKVDNYSINVSNLYIRNFEITKDGKYIFLNAMTNYSNGKGNNYVYAIPVKSSAEPVALYESSDGDESWAISNFCYDSINSALYFYAYTNKSHFTGSGLYICKKDADGEYTKDGVTNYFEPTGWDLYDSDDKMISDCLNADGTYDAAKFLAYLKSFYGRNSDKVYFTLDFFKNYKDAPDWCDESEVTARDGTTFDFAHKVGGWFSPYDDLYVTEDIYNADGTFKEADYYTEDVEDETDTEHGGISHPKGSMIDDFTHNPVKANKEGTVLTEESAMNFLLNFKYVNGEWDTTNKKWTLKEESPWEKHVYWYTRNNWKGAEFDSFPLWIFFTTNKDGTWTADTAAFPGDYDEGLYFDSAKTYTLSKWAGATGGIIIANNKGVWFMQDAYTDDDGDGVWTPGYSYIIQVANQAAQITMTQPDALADIKSYPYEHDWDDRETDDPWYKAPFKSTSKGFAFKGVDKHSLYYYDVAAGTCTKVYDNSKIASIYAFTLSKDSIVYNAVANNGGNRTGSINLTSKSESTINTDAQLQTITVVDIPDVGSSTTSDDTTTEETTKPSVSVDIGSKIGTVEIAPNYPWVNGVQDKTTISNYQTTLDITSFYGTDLPKTGDTLNVIWKGKSDIDISSLKIRVIDDSEAASWWKELTSASGDGLAVKEDLKAGETFDVSLDFTYTDDAVEKVSLCIWYEANAATGAATITAE